MILELIQTDSYNEQEIKELHNDPFESDVKMHVNCFKSINIIKDIRTIKTILEIVQYEV